MKKINENERSVHHEKVAEENVEQAKSSEEKYKSKYETPKAKVH